VFDVTRENIRHVAFGHGIHLCLGLNLARLEAKVAINALLKRFPDMTLADQEIVWTKIPLVRGMENLLIDTNEGAARIAAA
jgi:cytochrome P450